MGLAEEVGGTVVLLSGGHDSAYCALRACFDGIARPMGAFFDYGQPYLAEEVKASAYVATALKMQLVRLQLGTLASKDGIFDRRNERFVRFVAESPFVNGIYFGCRNPFSWFDRYGDSNWWWARRLSRELRLPIATPAVGLPKWFIRRALVRAGCDLSRLYSTEGLS